MPQTALIIKGNKVVAITTPVEGGGFLVNLHSTDDDFIPKSVIRMIEVENISEEDWHRGLRKGAAAAGDFVPGYSTNPEWNEPVDKENNGG